MKITDYINGNKFADLADFVIIPPFSYDVFSKNGIIFCKTDYLESFFELIKFSNRKYVLITHASDYEIDYLKFSRKPPCIKKWFAENAKYEHPDLIPIPIGIENTKEEKGCGKGLQIEENLKLLLEKQEYFINKKKIEDTIFCSFRVDYHFANGTWTNPLRKNIISILENLGIKYYQPNKSLAYPEFCEALTNYKFVMAPPGNGLGDTHRLWETLYMGCIPITLKSRIYKFYNLPILQVNNWTDLSTELLLDYLEGMKRDNFNNYEQLTMTYWKNRIIEEFNKL
jgi:hypothetical protein